MVDLDLLSVKKFTSGRESRFVLDIDQTAMSVPLDEAGLREIAAGVTHRVATTGNPAVAEQWVRTPKYWSAVLVWIRDLADAEEWLLEFAAALGALPGRILGGPRDRMQTDIDPRPAISGHLFLTTSDLRLVDSNVRSWFWGVDDTTSLYVAEQMLHWVHLPRGREHFTRSSDWCIETTGLDHALAVAEAAKIQSLHVRSSLKKPFRANYASLEPNGDLGVQTVDPDLDWHTRLNKVREALTWSPPRSDYGYVRLQSGGGASPDQGQTWPHILEHHVRYNRPLLTSYVPDAFGMQLLTDAHLERAHDLTDWDITPLKARRHLVAAQDLEAWFRPVKGTNEQGHPLPEVLPDDLDMVHKARADFGDMILTPEVIEAHDPWK